MPALDPITGLPLRSGITPSPMYADPGGSLPPIVVRDDPSTPGYTPQGGHVGGASPSSGPMNLEELLSLIRGSSLYTGAEAANRQAANMQRSASIGSIRQALIDAGLIPDMAAARNALGVIGDWWNEIRPEDIEAARKNPYSAEAQVVKGAKEATTGSINRIGARGMARSGETEYALQKIAETKAQSEYNIGRQFLDFLMQQQQGYISGESQRLSSLQAALQQAISALAPLYASRFTEEGSDNPAPPEPPAPPPPPITFVGDASSAGTGYLARGGPYIGTLPYGLRMGV